MKLTLISVILFLFGTINAQQAGTLDNSYGIAGMFRLDIPNYSESVLCMRILNTNHTLVLCNGYDYADSLRKLLLLKYKPDGAPDSSFGVNGRIAHHVSSYTSYGSDLLIQPDGKFLITHYAISPPYEWFVMRCNSNGSVDSTFGANGIVRLFTSMQQRKGVIDLQYLNSGQLLVGGTMEVQGQYQPSYIRLECDGRVDSTFGIGGITPAVGSSFNTHSVGVTKLLANGSFLAGGCYGYSHGDDWNLLLCRYLSNGLVDSSFGTNGVVNMSLVAGTSKDVVSDIEVLPDGKFIVGGCSEYLSGKFMLAKFNTNGTIDSSFGTDGSARYNLDTGEEMIADIYVQPDGRILTLGQSKSGMPVITERVFAARFNSNGSFDNSFGNAGLLWVNYGNNPNGPANFEIDNEGKMVLSSAHLSANPNGGWQYETVLARVHTGLAPTQCSPYNHHIQQTICPGGSYKYKCMELSSNVSITDTFVSRGGCDSIVTFTLATANINHTVSSAICAGETYFFGGQELSQAGVYTDTLIAAAGCDSVVSLNLSVLPAPGTSSSWAIICAGDTFSYNNKLYHNEGVYLDTFSTTDGCDSVIELNLTVNALPQPVVVQSNDTLYAGEFNTYYWLKDGVIYSDSIYYLIPVESGSYSVIVIDSNGCTNISGSVQVVISGIAEWGNEDIKVYPIPVKEVLNVSGMASAGVLKLIDNLGRVLYTLQTNGLSNEQVDMSSYANGVYLLRISDAKGISSTRRIIKQ